MSKKKTKLVPSKPVPPRAKTRLDGWYSALTGHGTVKDKRTYATFVADRTNYIENSELWRGDDLAGRIVETLPNEMLRQGWELNVEGKKGKDIQAKVMGLIEDLEVNEKLWTALCMEIAYGGAGTLLGTSDLEDFKDPLDLKTVQRLNFVETFEPSELNVASWQNDPTKKGFGQPLTYRLNPISPGGATHHGVIIHASRLLLFPGIRVSRRQVSAQAGWGDAKLTRCRETLRDFQTSWAAAGLLIADFAQAVWKIKGLAEIISLDKDDEIYSRIAAMELARSTVRASVIDADGEEFERKQTPVSGLPELLDRFATRLAASADIPVTLLMGMSPAGLNATGESDIRTFYDRVKSMQNRKLRPVLERLVKVAFAACGYEEPENWSIEFHPLWQPTDQEQAQTRLTQMQTDTGYIGASVFSAEEIRNQRAGGRKYSLNTHVDPDSVVEPKPEDAASPEYKDLLAQTAKGKPPQDRMAEDKAAEKAA